MKRSIKKLLRLRSDMGFNFYLADFFFRKIFRQNTNTPWAVHFTSTIHFPERIKRGKNVFPGDSPNNYIHALNGIEIGDYTNLGPNVGIISANHNLIDNLFHDAAPPIKIGRFCWVGMNAVILPGVQLGDFTIVGAGSVVTKSFSEGYCVVAGSPAKIIKHLDKHACIVYSRTKI